MLYRNASIGSRTALSGIEERRADVERWGRLTWRLGLSLWLGSIFFLFVAIAPNVFKVLPPAQAGRLVHAIFPVYDGEGLVLGALMLVGAGLLLGARRDLRRWILMAMTMINWLLAWWSWATLRTLQGVHESNPRFHTLHGESVVASVTMFLVGVGALVWDVLSI